MTGTEASRCVLLAGGGTGGHLFPGIVVAREVRRRHVTAKVVFAGTGRDVETRVLSRERFPLEQVRTVGLVGRSMTGVLRGLAMLPLGFLDAWRLLRRLRPDIVVGLGGYSSGPVVALASLCRIPTLLLEQNAVPGVTNRLLAPVVRAAAVSYASSLPFFGARGVVTGNPVRAAFFDTPPPKSVPDEPHILVLGGSQGAHAINIAMVKAAPSLATGTRPLRITHQSGEVDLQMVRDGYRAAGTMARVEPFLDAMDRAMSDADLVVCRAGATTLAELAAAGRPAILVPFPYAANDHQRLNATAFEKAGAAEVIDPDDLTAETLSDRVHALVSDDRRRVAMATQSRQLSRPDAAKSIVDRMEQLLAQT